MRYRMISARRQLLTTAAGGLAASLLLTIAMAQTPAATVHDYLKEVRIFAQGSSEFSQIASSLGVDATLHTLGQGASLVTPIRNDSGQAVELRILFQLAKGGKMQPHDMQVGRSLRVGEAALVAPREVGGALARLLNAGKPGMFSGSPTVEPPG